jgi:hypothetical protein
MEKRNKAGAPPKEPRKMIPTMLSLVNIWRLNQLGDKLNTGPKKSISRADIINEAAQYLCDSHDIPYPPMEKNRAGVEL